MTKGDAAIVVAYLVSLYPGWNATEEVLMVVGDLFAVEVLEVDDGRAIVKDHAARFEWPNVPGIAAVIRAAVNRKIVERNAAQAKAANASPSEHHKSITEWRDWYRDTPDGREEWKRLPANVRRGLRSMWKEVSA
jgi:hypothetical protein